MGATEALADRGLTLPELPDRLTNYLWFTQARDLIWISGQGRRTQRPISRSTARSSTVARTCSSPCSVRTAGTHVRRSG
jgi:hypothetical protein